MADERAEEVNNVVSMDNVGTLRLAGGLCGIRPQGADQAVNNDTDLWVVKESYTIKLRNKM